MYRLLELEAEKILGISKLQLPFPERGVITILGENRSDEMAESNGAGKSSVFDALAFALYGKPLRHIKRGELMPDSGKKNGFSRVLTQAEDGRKIQIVRWLNRSKADVTIDGKLIKIDSNDTGSLFSLDFQTMLNIHFLTRKDSFVFESRGTRQNLFERFVGLDVILDALKQSTSIEHKEIGSRLTFLSGKHASFKEEYRELQKKIKLAGRERVSKAEAEQISNIGIEVKSFEAGMQDTFKLLGACKESRLSGLRTEYYALDGDCFKLRREVRWSRETLAKYRKELAIARTGRCTLCKNRLPAEKIRSELNRLLGLMKENKAYRIEKNNELIEKTERKNELQQQINSIDKEFGELRDACEGLMLKLENLKTLVAERQMRAATAAQAAKTRFGMVRDAKVAVIASIKELATEYRELKRLETVSHAGTHFVNSNLRQIMLATYLQQFNKDLKTTLKLFAGFKGHFTPDFDIVVRDKSFNAVSTGEQMRFVLATYMNLFRYCALNKSRFNFLGFDDFDLGVDAVGRRALADTFDLLGQNLCVFVASQASEFNNFPYRLIAIKENGLTHYELEGF
jgi:DNA repair exonuclease SbcCD ATPase subunit